MIKNGLFELHQISYQYGRRTILDEVSFRISHNDFILMTGQNGSGKSTLLRILAGLLRPSTANIKIDQRVHTWRQARDHLRQRVCYLHQQPYLFHGSVFDNIAYGLKRKRKSRDEIRQHVSKALELFSLEDLMARDCRELSGGEKQRVAIVRSWIIKPDIILLDEPFANMDKESRVQCYKLINQLQQDNIAVVVTSHDPQKGNLNFNQHQHLYQGKMIQKML